MKNKKMLKKSKIKNMFLGFGSISDHGFYQNPGDSPRAEYIPGGR